jgi:hypothetical protein
MPDTGFKYDVCLSFAGEDRDYVEAVAEGLRERGIRVFYDRHAKAEMWGKDLYEHLDYVYGKAARYCVLFASDAYARKVWTSHERKSAQERAIGENREYILPARFDDTKVPGLRGTVGYVDLRETEPAELVELIREKLGPQTHENFFPPEPDLLFAALDTDDVEEHELIKAHAYRFFEVLRRMSHDERLVVATIFRDGCPVEMPENLHMSLDLMRRVTGMPVTQITETLSGLGSLGFVLHIRDDENAEHSSSDDPDLADSGPLAVIGWNNLSATEETFEGEAFVVADAMLRVVNEHYCEEHSQQAVVDLLNFSSLASSTQTEHVHEVAA